MAKKKPTGTDDLPGMTGKGVVGVVIEEITKAANKYERKKDARCQASPGEVAAKQELRELLHKHRDQLPTNEDGNPFYRHDNTDYILTEKLVRRGADDGEVRGEEV